jgi:FAD binding domain
MSIQPHPPAQDRFVRGAETPDTASEEAPLTAAERRLRVLLRILTVVFAFAAPLFLVATLGVRGHASWAQVGFSINSVTKVGALAGIAALAAANVRRFSVLVPLLAVAHVISVAAILVILLAADTSASFHLLGGDISLTALLIGAVVMDGGIALLLIVFYVAARRARYRLDYLPPLAFEALAALADVVVVRVEEEIAPPEVARNVDRYMSSFEARRRWVVPVALAALWLYPLRFLWAPFPLMAPPERRQFVEQRFRADIATRRLHFLRRAVQAMIRLSLQMVYLGYYGDSRTFASVGYAPFSQRPRFPSVVPSKTLEHPRLETLTHDEVKNETLDADVVVIGSGAGGGVTGYRLAEAGRRVLILEAGKHVDRHQFTEDEVTQISRISTPTVRFSSRAISAFRSCKGNASAAARPSTTQSASTCPITSWRTGTTTSGRAWMALRCVARLPRSAS